MSTETKRQAVVAEIPRLRRYAIALMRDRTKADDLVHDVVLRALDKLHLRREGTNMRTWLFTIMHNLHANEMRRRSRMLDVVPLDSAPARAEPAVRTPLSNGRNCQVPWVDCPNCTARCFCWWGLRA